MIQDGVVVAFQQFIVEKPGRPSETAEHPNPIQTYPLKRFQDQYAIAPGEKRNGFAQLGLLVTPLHVPDEGLEPDEDFDLPEGGVAEVAPNSTDETIKKTVEAINSGTSLSDAQLLTERAKVVEEGDEANGEGQLSEEELQAQIEEQKKLGDAATASSVAKATENAVAAGDAVPVKKLSAAQQAKADKAAKASGK